MVSIWLAHQAPHVAIRLGMWHEAGVDEREAWGYLLADVVRNVSQGLARLGGWDPAETTQRVLDSLARHSQNSRPPAQGRFTDEGKQGR
jgi:hypothetical protein